MLLWRKLSLPYYKEGLKIHGHLYAYFFHLRDRFLSINPHVEIETDTLYLFHLVTSRRLAVWCCLLDNAQVWICPYSPVLWGISSQTQNLSHRVSVSPSAACWTRAGGFLKRAFIDWFIFLTQRPLMLLELWRSDYQTHATHSTHFGAMLLKKSAVSRSHSCTYSLSFFPLPCLFFSFPMKKADHCCKINFSISIFVFFSSTKTGLVKICYYIIKKYCVPKIYLDTCR